MFIYFDNKHMESNTSEFHAQIMLLVLRLEEHIKLLFERFEQR